MARTSLACLIIFVSITTLACTLSVIGKLDCEELPVELCAFAVSSDGARCILEKSVTAKGHVEYECQTSIVTADQFVDWLETDDCVNSCGLERMCVGLSSDALVDSRFAKTLCSAYCQDNCPNVVDLYTKLAAGEGVPLPEVCKAQRTKSRRMMGEMTILASKSTNTLSAWELTAAAAPSSHVPGSQTLLTASAPAPAMA